MSDLAACAGLFLAALVAATILPAQSEAVLVALLLLGEQPAWLLVAVASAGNILGSTLNWLIGMGIGRFGISIAADKRERAERWYRRWGRWSLLLSWVPIVGDPITLAAGMMREPLPIFLLLVAIAKTGRYIALAAITLGWM